MKELKSIIGLGILFFTFYLAFEENNEKNSAIKTYLYWDSLGYSGADTAVYRSLEEDKKFQNKQFK